MDRLATIRYPDRAAVVRSGDHNPRLHLGDRTVALAVCAEIGDPAHVAAAAKRGANLYAASTFVIPSEFEGEVSKLGGYARQHRMMTALANFGSPSGGLKSAGRSSIWDETSKLLAQLDAHGSGVAISNGNVIERL